MKSVFVVLFSVLLFIDPTAIGKINTAKSEAKKAFYEGKYKEAIEKYRYLIDKLGVDEDEVKMNLAHAYYLQNDTTNCKPLYQALTQSQKNEIRSNAFQQLGIMTNKKGKSEEALSQFKQAVKADPTNRDARYNYEMLKKKLEEQKKKDQQKQDQNKDQKDKNKDQKDQNQDKKDQDKKDQDQKNKDQQKKDEQNKKDQKDKKGQNKDQQNKDQKEQEKKEQEKKEQEKKEQKEKEEKEKKDQQSQQQQKEDQKDKKKDEKVPQQVADKLKQMNMSEEKAKMILEAMKNQEVQYLQQNRRKASKPRDKGKPDW